MRRCDVGYQRIEFQLDDRHPPVDLEQSCDVGMQLPGEPDRCAIHQHLGASSRMEPGERRRAAHQLAPRRLAQCLHHGQRRCGIRPGSGCVESGRAEGSSDGHGKAVGLVRHATVLRPRAGIEGTARLEQRHRPYAAIAVVAHVAQQPRQQVLAQLGLIVTQGVSHRDDLGRRCRSEGVQLFL